MPLSRHSNSTWRLPINWLPSKHQALRPSEPPDWSAFCIHDERRTTRVSSRDPVAFKPPRSPRARIEGGSTRAGPWSRRSAVDGFAHVAAQVVCVVAVCGCQTRGWCTSKMISVVATPLPPCAPSHGCPHQAIRGSSMTSPASRSRYRAQDSMSARRFSNRSERASACSTTLPTL